MSTTISTQIVTAAQRMAPQPNDGICEKVVRKMAVGSCLAAAQAAATANMVHKSVILLVNLPGFFRGNAGDVGFQEGHNGLRRALGDFGNATVQQFQNLTEW